MDNQQGLVEQHMELCSVLCGSLDARGVCGVGGRLILVFVWLSPLAAHLKPANWLSYSRRVVSDSL